MPPIAGRYLVDPGRPLPGAGGGGTGGGLAAFAATDRRDAGAMLMAVQVRATQPARARALDVLSTFNEGRVLMPLAYGPALGADGKPACFVICPAPPGPPLWPVGATTVRPWGEGELVSRLMRPAAAALAALELRAVTHRAIRPENVFADPNGQPATLGCAWASPPALLQPALFEPPYIAMCAGPARGEGRIADDVYALGVTMLVLALGRLPLAGLDEDAIIARKLELGCFQALVGEAKLPPLIADLVAGMLAQDPLHRPSPALLGDPAAARARRVAARPARRATRPMELGKYSAGDARSLAFAVAREPEQSARALRLGVVDHWLRRELGDAVIAGKIEEAVRQRVTDGRPDDRLADARLVMRAALVLDPLGPLCWNGLALWPDGIGPALVVPPAVDGHTDDSVRARAEEVISSDATVLWGLLRGDVAEVNVLRDEARKARALVKLRSWAGGTQRLVYTLNPLLPCRSPVLGGWPVAQLSDVMPALEVVASRQEPSAAPPIDRDLAAFLAARQEGRADAELAALSEAATPHAAAIAQLRVLGHLQVRLAAGPLPALCAWVAAAAAPALEVWHNRARRIERQNALAAAVPKGDLAALLAILEDPAALEADRQGHAEALARAAQIDQQLHAIASGGADRAETALRIGQEIAAAIGLAALAASGVAAALR